MRFAKFWVKQSKNCEKSNLCLSQDKANQGNLVSCETNSPAISIITSHHNGQIAARCGMVVQNEKVTYRIFVCWLFCQFHVRIGVCPLLCGIYVECKHTLTQPKYIWAGKNFGLNLFRNQTNGLCGLPTILKGIPTMLYKFLMDWWEKNIRLAFYVEFQIGTLVLIHGQHLWEIGKITLKTCSYGILS